MKEQYEFISHNIQKVKPGSKKTIFINPSYSERVYWADLIINNYNDRLPAAGYNKPDIYKDDQATFDIFQNLSDYGIIHIYSQGWGLAR